MWHDGILLLNWSGDQNFSAFPLIFRDFIADNVLTKREGVICCPRCLFAYNIYKQPFTVKFWLSHFSSCLEEIKLLRSGDSPTSYSNLSSNSRSFGMVVWPSEYQLLACQTMVTMDFPMMRVRYEFHKLVGWSEKCVQFH